MGFQQLYKDIENPFGYLTTSFLYPKNPLFVFDEFQSRLSDYGKIFLFAKQMTVVQVKHYLGLRETGPHHPHLKSAQRKKKKFSPK